MTTTGWTFRGVAGGFGIQLNEANERAMAVSRMNLDDAVFHYTSAEGLFGILSSGSALEHRSPGLRQPRHELLGRRRQKRARLAHERAKIAREEADGGG